jgi:type III secretion system YscQ/HrcQ family protein
VARRYRFDNLPSFSHNEVLLWNWYCRAVPGGEWRAWAKDIFSHLLEKPSGHQLRLMQSNVVEAQSGEKVLEFGSKTELFLGRHEENDVVLPAKAIASKHAHLALKDGQLHLEDLGGQLGTYFWDTKISPRSKQLVRSGDQFTIFPYRFRVQIDPSWKAETDVALDDYSFRLGTRSEYMGKTPPGSTSFVLDAHPGLEKVLLGISPAFLAALVQRTLQPLGVKSGKQPVASDDAVLGFILFALLERMNRKLKFPQQFSFARNTKNAGPGETKGISVSLALKVDDLTGHIRLFLPLAFLSPSDTSAAENGGTNYPIGLAWKFPISAGFVDLGFEDTSQLSLGDIIVAQHAPAILFPNDFGKGWLMTAEGSNFERCKLDKYYEGGVSVTDGTDVSATQDKPSIDTLPLRLHVILAEKEFTLAEIQSFNPGTIVELGGSKLEPVRLMVNGRILGEGELVEVEGSLAVRVLGWRTN